LYRGTKLLESFSRSTGEHSTGADGSNSCTCVQSYRSITRLQVYRYSTGVHMYSSSTVDRGVGILQECTGIGLVHGYTRPCLVQECTGSEVVQGNPSTCRMVQV